MVELAPGKPRVLCPTHRDGVAAALESPLVYRVWWGEPPSEKLAALQAQLATMSARLGSMPRPDPWTDGGPDGDAWYALAAQVDDLQAEVDSYSDGYSDRPDHPIVNVTVLTGERRPR